LGTRLSALVALISQFNTPIFHLPQTPQLCVPN
jgi:hypothetical protein